MVYNKKNLEKFKEYIETIRREVKSPAHSRESGAPCSKMLETIANSVTVIDIANV